MNAYILLTRGPRHFADIRKVENAQRQITNLEAFATEKGVNSTKLYHDYCRKVRGLDDLPILKTLLGACAQGDAAVVVDDLQWIFRHIRFSDRKRFFEQLRPFAEHLVDIRLGKLLSRFTEKDLRILIVAEDGPFYLKRIKRAGTGSKQTKRANRVSAIARRHKSLAKARELAALNQELESGGREAGYAGLARAANDQQLLTTTGGRWSRATVRSALLRLADYEASKPAIEIDGGLED